MNILKNIDSNKKNKLKEMSKILKSTKKNYTVLFKDNMITLTLNKKKIFTSDFKLYGILQPNNLWIWATSIPGINYPNINHIKKIKNMSYLFEGNMNPRLLFYHQFLTQDVILINDEEQIEWINKLILYLDNSLYYLNPTNHKNNIQFITVSNIYEKYI
jgi:hypothetical protein